MIELSQHELRQVALYAAQCARRCLSIFEEQCPDDPRPRLAIEAAETFAAGGPRTTDLRTLAWAAHKAASQTQHPAAAQAARAASSAAAAAYLHPLPNPHQLKHILGAATHQALAAELASDAEVQKSIQQAPATVREVLRRYPPSPSGSNRTAHILHQLDTALRRG